MGEVIIGFISGAFVAAMACIILLSEPTDFQKEAVICEYKGGTMKDDVCIVNDRVIKINLKEK